MSKKQKPWREVLPVHPAAERTPLMSAEQLRELADDIAKHGLREPVTIWRKAYAPMTLLDGRNRLSALELLGCEIFHTEKGEIDWFHKTCVGNSPNFRIFQVETWIEDPVAFVKSKNLHRLHVGDEQRRELLTKELKANPEKSDRQIALVAGCDHKTVGIVRREAEARGEIPHVEKRSDTRGRKQPAGKGARKKAPAPDKPAVEAPASPDVARARVEALANPGAEASTEVRKAVNVGLDTTPPAAVEPISKTWEIAKGKGEAKGVSLEDLKRGACDDDEATLLSDGEYLALTANELRACIDEIGFIVIRYSDGTLYAKPVLASDATAQSDPGGSSYAMLLEEIRNGIRRPTHPHAKTRAMETCAKDQEPKPLDLPADGSIPAFMDRTAGGVK